MPFSGCYFYNLFNNRENTWQGGFASPKRVEGWLHESQIELLNELVKALGNNQVITDNLRVFIKRVQLPITNGIILYPKDYRRFASLSYFSKKDNGVGCKCSDLEIVGGDQTCRELTEEEKADLMSSDQLCENRIELVDNQLWSSICEDEIAGPSLENPYGTQDEKGFRANPKSIGIVVLYYIAIPPRPIFKFDRDARQNFTCLPGTSDLLWGEEMLPELLARVKKRYNAFVGNGEGYQQGESERQITTS